jgi:hypothetical protein
VVAPGIYVFVTDDPAALAEKSGAGARTGGRTASTGRQGCGGGTASRLFLAAPGLRDVAPAGMPHG